jgi:hypothetical protein
MEEYMGRTLLTAAALVAMSGFAMAQDYPTSKEEKAAEELGKGSNPATNPTAKPEREYWPKHTDRPPY